MKFQSRFITVRALSFAGLLLVTGGVAVSPCRAATPQAESDAERYVLDQLQRGSEADLKAGFPSDKFSDDKRKLRGEFLKALFTNRDPHLQFPRGIDIRYAVISGEFDLAGAEVPHNVSMLECVFEGSLDFTDSHFAKSLVFISGKLRGGFQLERARVERNFAALDCGFTEAHFNGFSVGETFIVEACTFNGREISFANSQVGGAFSVTSSEFRSEAVDFSGIHVGGAFYARRCFFKFAQPQERPNSSGRMSAVSFADTRAADFFLNGSGFENVAIIDFSRLQADLISFDNVKINSPAQVSHQQMTFKTLSPVNAQELSWLLTPYDAEFYAAMESSFRSHGYPNEADRIFIDGKRAQRRQTCSNFWRQCENRGGFLWGVFQDALAGYGKRLENLLYWSLGFLIIGTIVFWKQDGMRLKDEKAAAYGGRYHAFWYSLDLFLPIIKLGETDIWTPKETRRWAILYKKVHIVIGSLFVPIGLAAWTGLIK